MSEKDLDDFIYYIIQYCNDKCLEFGRFYESYYKGRCKSYEDIKRFIVSYYEFNFKEKNKL